jgi:hypothetical protein
MISEDSYSKQNKFFFEKQIRRKSEVLIFLVGAIFLQLAFAPLSSFANSLDQYGVGRGGEFPCFPAEDKTSCRETTDDPRLRLASEKILKKCVQWAADPKTHEKYGAALTGLAIPGVGIKFVAAYFLSEGLDDLGQCIAGGLLEYLGYSERAIDSILKTAFAMKDAHGLRDKLKQFDPEDRIKTFELPFEGKDRTQDFNEIVQDEGILSLNEIKTFSQLYNEYFKGVAGTTKNRLDEAEKKMAVCQFNEAEGMIKSAEALTKSYCEERGKQYRWLEKNIRCLEEKHKKWIEKIFSSNRPPLEALPLEDRRRIEREMQTIGPQTIKAREEVINGQKELLATWENEILENLKIFDVVKNKRKLLEEKKADFEKKKEEYDKEKEKAISALQGGDLKTVCEQLVRIKQLESNFRQLSPDCFQKICGYRDGRLWGDFLEEALKKNAEGLKDDVKILLEKVKVALEEKPCKLDVAREKLTECDQIVEKIRIYSGGSCVKDYGLERDVKEAWARFNTIEQNGKTIWALLEKAENLAKNECTFDQALSNETTEENIKKNLKNSCIEEKEVDDRLKRIKRLMEMFQLKAEAEEKAIFNMITGLHELINPTVPKCDIEGALKMLGEAENRFKEHLECANTNPGPSSEVRARAERVRAALETSRQFISSRSSEINQARRQYRQMVNSLFVKTDDPCHYQEAMSQPLRESLTGWAREFCKPEEANRDIQTLQEAIRKWDERIKKEMEALRQSITKVEREQNCQAAEELLKKQKENLSYLMDCEGHKEPLRKAFDTMESAISKKKKEADQKIQQALNAGQNSLAKCVNLEQALNQIKQTKSAGNDSCVSTNLLTKRDNLIEQLDQQIWDLQDRKKGIYVLLSEAEKTLKTCEWDAMESQLSEAKQTLPGEPCFSSQSVFSDLNRRILDLESRERTKEEKVKWYWARHLIIIRNAKAYLNAKNSGQNWGTQLQKDYNDTIADLQRFIQGVEKENLTDCLNELVSEARDMIAQMGGPPQDRTDQASANIGGPTSGRIDPPATDPCRSWPGSVPILDRNKQITCICPNDRGLFWNQSRTRCISCAEYESRFTGALNSNDLNSAQGLLNEAVNCPWYSKGAAALDQRRRNQERCTQIDSSLVAASQAKDVNRFRALVEQARVENCNFYQNAYSHLQNWERCLQIDSALVAASKAKDINRFRALVEQARVGNCDFYQTAYNHLRNWEQELQRSAMQPPLHPPIQPQPPTSPPTKPQSQPPPPDNRKWIVWHDCAGPSFACVLDLSRTTEEELRRNRAGRKITIFGVYNTEQEARRATCGRFTGIRAGGQFAAGTLGNIGNSVYCVKNFFYWDNRENRYKCR